MWVIVRSYYVGFAKSNVIPIRGSLLSEGRKNGMRKRG